MSAVAFDFELNKKQVLFIKALEDPAIHTIGFGGAKKGGKSWIARHSMLRRRMEFPGTNCVITRTALADVMGNHYEQIKLLMREWGLWTGKVTDKRARWDATYMCFELNQFRHKGVPSKLYLGFAEKERDADRYQGHEFMDIFHEEAAQHEYKVLAAINKELFVPPHVKGGTPKKIYTWNPDGIGKRDMKERIKMPAIRGVPGFAYIFSNYRDNPHVLRSNPNFANNIREEFKNEPWKIAAHLEGDDNSDPNKWYVFDEEEGGKNVRSLVIPPHAKHFAGVDYGYSSSAFAAVYFAKWQDRVFPYQKHWHAYGEIREFRLEPDEQARRALEYEIEIGFPPPPYSIRYTGFEASFHVPTRRGEMDSTIAQMWASTKLPGGNEDDYGWVTTPARKSGRNAGNSIYRKMLKDGTATIDPSCVCLIQEIAAAQHEKLQDGRIGPGTDPGQPDDMQDAAKHPTKEQWDAEYSKASGIEEYEEAA